MDEKDQNKKRQKKENRKKREQKKEQSEKKSKAEKKKKERTQKEVLPLNYYNRSFQYLIFQLQYIFFSFDDQNLVKNKKLRKEKNPVNLKANEKGKSGKRKTEGRTDKKIEKL